MKKLFIPVILIVFVILSVVFYMMKTAAPAYNFTVLMTGNAVMAVLSIISYLLVQRQIGSGASAFVRGVYSSSFLKLLVCIISILTYVIVNKPNIHKPSLFVLFGIYAVYSIAETWLLSRMAREAK